MANVTYNAIASASGAPGNFIASDMWSHHTTSGGNFNRITDQVNGGLDTANYATSGFLSQHFKHNAIVSQHFSNNAILSAKISDSAVLEANMNYESASDGVRLVRIGKAGLKRARYQVSKELTGGGAQHSETLRVSFSGAEDGNPAFTATPTVAAQPIYETNTAVVMRECFFTAINSVQADMVMWFPAGVYTESVTFHIFADGF